MWQSSGALLLVLLVLVLLAAVVVANEPPNGGWSPSPTGYVVMADVAQWGRASAL